MKCNVKAVLFLLVMIGFTALISACSGGEEDNTAYVPPAKFDAVVDANHSGDDGALMDGSKTFKTVQSALIDAPGDAAAPYIIFIKKGTYFEKLVVDKPYITFIGEDRNETRIAYNDASGSPKAGGGTIGTAGSASVTVKAPRFRAENLTIENTFDHMGNAAKADSDPTKIAGQAVALLTEEGSEEAYFYRVNILGYQDTLFVDFGKQYFKESRITGTVDFIFGGGQALFDECEIVSMDRGSNNNGVITAPSTGIRYKYGIAFYNSKLLKEKPEMADDSVDLGRPWRAGGNTIYINNYMDAHISAKGWTGMGNNTIEHGKFMEYGSTGPGAKTSDTRKPLPANEGAAYTLDYFLEGWNVAAYAPWQST